MKDAKPQIPKVRTKGFPKGKVQLLQLQRR